MELDIIGTDEEIQNFNNLIYYLIRGINPVNEIFIDNYSCVTPPDLGSAFCNLRFKRIKKENKINNQNKSDMGENKWQA